MNILDIIVSLITLLAVILTARQNIFCWVFGLISTTMLTYIYFINTMYAQVLLQLIFLFQCIYGWYYWKINSKNINFNLTHVGFSCIIKDLLIFVAIGLYMGIICKYFNISKQPILDSVTAFIGLLANWYVIRKIIQGWLLFMLFNILLIIMLLLNGSYILVWLNIILFFLSLNGYVSWKLKFKVK